MKRTSRKMSRRKTAGNMTEFLVDQDVEWKIPNFLSLIEQTNDILKSPRFDFCGETWRLELYTCGDSRDFEEKYIKADLVNENPDCESQGVEYRIGLKKIDGTEYVNFSAKTESEDDQSESEDNQTSPRAKKWVKTSTIRNHSDELLPQGILMVFCDLRRNENEKMDTRAETPAGTDELAKDFENLRTTQERNNEVTFKLKGEEIKALKNVLRERSAVFASMFDQDMAAQNFDVIDVPDCDPQAFQYFLLYLYSANIDNLSNGIVFNLYFIADKYDVKELKRKCLEFMENNLSADTFCNAVALALQYQEMGLMQTATDFFVMHSDEIMASIPWQSFVRENPVTANELYEKAVMHK